MKNEYLEDPAQFFHNLGGMHDADIKKITWDPVARTLALSVDDINSNFFGLPEYIGQQKGNFIFYSIDGLFFNCDSLKGETQRIYRILISKTDDFPDYNIEIRISPSGRLAFAFQSVQLFILS